MQIVNLKDIGLTKAQELLQKPPFDEVELSPKIKALNKELFGEDLSAEEIVHKIVAAVRKDGDKALIHYTELIDKLTLNPETIKVRGAEIEAAYQKADQAVVAALKEAAANIQSYHQEQKPKSFLTYRGSGSIIGQSLIPLERVGIYVPGGTAAYPSSVLMNAVPAKVAGVKEIVMVVPARNGEINPYVLIAADIAGVTDIYKIGGAQAIAALAFGTDTIPKVDKITGPGNIFVTLAKKAVYGHVDIDMLAGPSEILILADHSADAVYTAADMLSQAEHDPLASSILITTSNELALNVRQELQVQLAKLPRREIAQSSLDNNGLIIIADNLEDAILLANTSAPEHMELLVENPFSILPKIKHAGAIFLGHYSPEPLGDYFAGPNHVLPTGGTARFYSVLNVETFMKRTSIISYTEEDLLAKSDTIIRLAEAEGLVAHANAIRVRQGEEDV